MRGCLCPGLRNNVRYHAAKTHKDFQMGPVLNFTLQIASRRLNNG